MAANVGLTIMQLYTEDMTEETGLKETNSGKEIKMKTTKIKSWKLLK